MHPKIKIHNKTNILVMNLHGFNKVKIRKLTQCKVELLVCSAKHNGVLASIRRDQYHLNDHQEADPQFLYYSSLQLEFQLDPHWVNILCNASSTM